MLWEYRDDPYLHDYMAMEEETLLQQLKSMYKDNRMLALRAFSERSARLRNEGDTLGAERLVQIILRHYEKERHPDVQQCIVQLCAPVCGVGSRRMEIFLRQRLAEGRWTRAAARSLAALDLKDSVSLLRPLLKHPSHIVRYEAALILCTSRDPEARNLVRELHADMADWPPRFGDLSLAEAEANLAARLKRMERSTDSVTAPASRP